MRAADSVPSALEAPFSRVLRLDPHRLKTLVRLRWYALISVTVALVMALLFGFEGLNWPVLILFGVLGLVYNGILSLRASSVWFGRFQQIYYVQLVFDISALTGLLWAAGGLANPFSMLFIVHVVVAALIGSFEAVIVAGCMATAAAICLYVLELFDALLGIWSPPLAWADSAELLALAVVAGSIAWLVASQSRRAQIREVRLSEAQVAIHLREQVLNRVLNGLSAALEIVEDGKIIWQNEAMEAIRTLTLGDEWVCPGRIRSCNRSSYQGEEPSCSTPGHREPQSCLISVQTTAGAKVYRKYAWEVQSGVRSETVHFYVDETRRLAEDERLKLTERLASLGRLAQGIAHELNTPLSTVRTLTLDITSALNDDRGLSPATRADVDESLALSLRELERCARITRGLLSGRGLEGSSRPQRQPLHPLIQEAVTLVSVGSRRRHQIRVEANGEAAYVDPDAFLQVLVNLLSNAVDASAPGSEIAIQCLELESYTRLEVVDQGEGIAPDIRSRLFEPFATTKPVGQGTGLGLYMVRMLLEEIGGTIELFPGPVAGTIARIDLYRSQEAAQNGEV